MRRVIWILLALLILCVVCLGVYYLPPVYERMSWRVANVRSQIYYALNPPEEAVFLPQEQQELIEAIVAATMLALQPSPTSTLQPSPTPEPELPTPTALPSPTVTLVPTPIPGRVILNGITHEYQKMNNCGPATLSMTLSYWGWGGSQIDTRAYLRPRFTDVDDKNVSPEEMAAYVVKFTGLKALVRYGGDVDLIKRLVAAGYPVMVEKASNRPKKNGWAITG